MTTITQLLPDVDQTLRSRLILMIGQGLALGLILSLLLVIGNALFLSDFGAAVLPYVYITVALTGSLLSYGFVALQNRFTLPQLTITTLSGLVLFFIVCWLGITTFPMRWVSFALVATFSLLIQLGFVFLGGQAGRLFDVRQIRQMFPLIVAGFVIGFIIGALTVPLMIDWLGSIANASISLAGSALLWLILLIITARLYRQELGHSQSHSRRRTPPQSLSQLLRKPFVRFVFLYQMLAIAINQLTDFVLLAQVGQRYLDSDSTAQFFSRFTVVLNGADLLFTTLIAGYFFSRFGLNAGLLANPIAIGTVLLSMLISYLAVGPTSTLFFLLAVGLRIAIITLTDGATRTSINTTYQALPVPERGPVQAGAEGIGGPLALGLVGIFLLIFNTITGLTIGHLVFFMLVLATVWLGMGLLVYRHYVRTLLHTLRRRILSEEDGLALDDGSSLAVVKRMANSQRPSEVQLALDLLAQGNVPAWEKSLISLLSQPDEALQHLALQRLESHPLPAAQPLVEALWQGEGSPQVKGLALRALCACRGAESVEWIAPCLDSPSEPIRFNALVGLLRHGGIAGVLLAGQRVITLANSTVTAERQTAAQVIGAVGQSNFYQPLLSLLADNDTQVRQAALLAAAQLRNLQLLTLVVDNLGHPATRSAAATALMAYGTAILPLVEQALLGTKPLAPAQLTRLIRICGQVKGEAVVALCQQYIDYPHREIREQILMTLHHCGFQARTADAPRLMTVMRAEVAYAAQALATQINLGQDEAFTPLQRALHDEWTQVRHNLFYLLAFLYDSRAMIKAGQQLVRGSDSEKALALELLDVTLTAEQKGLIFPLIRPQLIPAQRQQQLNAQFPDTPMTQTERLQQIISGDMALHVWTRSCAIYAAARLGLQALKPIIANIQGSNDPILQETAVFALQHLTG